MSDSQLKDNVKQEIESMLPLEHGEYCIDYKVLEYIKNEDSGILVKSVYWLLPFLRRWWMIIFNHERVGLRSAILMYTQYSWKTMQIY